MDAAANPGESLPWIYDHLDREEVSREQRDMSEWERAGEENSHPRKLIVVYKGFDPSSTFS